VKLKLHAGDWFTRGCGRLADAASRQWRRRRTGRQSRAPRFAPVSGV